MAGFCVSCGSPLTGAFCNKCGARAVTPGASPAQPVASSTPPPIQASAPSAVQPTAQPAEDGRVFAFTVQRGAGPDSWAGGRLAQAAVPGFEEVHGVGDHAMIGSFGHAFYVQKGDAMIDLETTWGPDARTRGTVIGKKIIGNL